MSRPHQFRLFLSHTSLNRSTAGYLRPALLQYGISLFAAHDDIEPNSEWRVQLEKALKASHALAALLTADFHASEWTDHEVGYAFGANKVILPLIYDAVPYGLLGKFQGIKIAGRSYGQIAYEIADLLVIHPKARKRMAEALAASLIAARSTEHIEVLAGLLSRPKKISKDAVALIEKAITANSRIKKTNRLRFWISDIAENYRFENERRL
jgi:hypothetical protein